MSTEQTSPNTPMRELITPSIQGIQGTILFQEQDKAIQHVLETLLGMSPTIIDQVKAWMNYQDASCMAHLMDLYTESQRSILQSEYKIGETKNHLSKLVTTGLYFACKYGANKIKPLILLLRNEDWLSFTIDYFNNFQLGKIKISSPWV